MSCSTNLYELLRATAQAWPKRLAVSDGAWNLSYAQLDDRVRRLAGALTERGLAPGDRLALLEINSPAFLEATFAAAAAGAVLVPLNHRLAVPEQTAVLVDSGACHLLAACRFADQVAGLRAAGADLAPVAWIGLDPPSGEPAYEALLAAAPGGFSPRPGRPDGLAQLYYTSGTTGRPKGVMLTHENVCRHAAAAVVELGLCADDVWAHVAPMFHLADAWASLAMTAVGGRHAMIPRFEALEVLAAIERERVTVTNLIPSMLNLLVKHPDLASCDLSSLRLILSGGAPIAPVLVAQVMEGFGCRYVQTYGLTETSPFLTLGILPEHLERLPEPQRLAMRAKTGRPFAGVELRVVDAEGRPVRTDGASVGEIQVRAKTVTPGYWNQPEQTAAAFTPDGFLRTGDLATLDAEGFVNIVDRIKDMIITGGENVYSTEVEYALYQHPAVLEAAVYGLPDERWGEAVCAAVVLKDGQAASPEELIAFCRTLLASYKTPKRIEFLDSLPRTGSGKIAKRLLRARNIPGQHADRGGDAS